MAFVSHHNKEKVNILNIDYSTGINLGDSQK